ncbi:MAG: ABC transporter ATP-binding protein [Spirochaetales bacterium]
MISLLRRLWPFVRRYRRNLGIAILFMIPFDLVAYSVPLVIGYVVDYVYPEIRAGEPLDALWIATGFLVVAGVLRGITAHLMIRNFWFVAESVVKDIRSRLYDKLQHLDLSFYDKARTGDLMSRVTYDIQLLRNFFAFGIEHRIRIVAITVTIFAIMLWQEWRLALAVYTVVPFFFAVIIYYSRKMREAVRRKQEQMGRLNARVQENVTGIRVVKAFSMEHAEIDRFDAENRDMLEKDLDMSLLQVLLNPVLLLTDGVGSLVILLFGGYQVIEGTMSLGVLFAFVSYLGVIRFPMNILAFNTSLLNLATGACNRLFEILNAPDQKRYDTGTCTGPIEGRVTFDHVRFEYEDGRTVLDNLSFDIAPGERVALFGLTGAGKSTLISLIPRFYLPTYGRILIDNRDITEWNMRYLRSQIGTVMQETFLFSASIGENIAFARPAATRQEVEQAARYAHIHDFIVSLPNGYETIVGEYGVGLSGGQKQRVAIARTLLQDPKLLILDDCTSSLDAVTEQMIQDELRVLMQGRTTILVAQRVSTLALADRIIVLEDGGISDIDSHDRLLERNTLYRTTYAAQTASPGDPIQEATD